MEERTAEHIEKILGDIVKGFISHPEDMEITTRIFTGMISFQIRLHKADTGRMIGEAGSMIKSIQYLLSEIGDSIDARIKLKVLEPEAGSQEPLEFYEFKRRDDWPGEEVRDLLGRLATMIFTDSPGPEVTLEDGDGESALILKVSDSTPEILIDGFPGDRWALGCQTALDTLFNAIAKNKGWEVFVQIKPDLEYEAQPETSDGRFAKERP